MRVFVTGASGWIGSAVVPELLGAGHQVVALARSESSAAALRAAGAQVHPGSLEDLDSLRSGVAASDGVVHLAFRHDLAFSGDFEGAAEADYRAIEVFGETLSGSDRPLLIASGVLGLAPGRVSTERDGHDLAPTPLSPSGPSRRHANAELTLSFAERGVRSSIVRFAPTVHGDGDHGFVATLVSIARERGVSGYIGDGAQRWPTVHRLDAARLVRLTLEEAPAATTVHAVAEEGVAIRDVAAVIGRHLGEEVISVAPSDAAAHFTWLARFLAIDSPSSNVLTRELVAWSPTQPGLLADLDEGHYFRER